MPFEAAFNSFTTRWEQGPSILKVGPRSPQMQTEMLVLCVKAPECEKKLSWASCGVQITLFFVCFVLFFETRFLK